MYKKRACRMVDFASGKNQRKRKERQVLGPCSRTKKSVEYEGVGDTNCNWCA